MLTINFQDIILCQIFTEQSYGQKILTSLINLGQDRMNKTYIFGSISPNRSTLSEDIQVLIDSMISIFTQNFLYCLNQENAENLNKQQVVGK